MLSIDFIKQNLEAVKAAAKNKNRPVDLDKILKLDQANRQLLTQISQLRQERNNLAKQKDAQKNAEVGRRLKTEVKQMEEKQAELGAQLKQLLAQVPNVPYKEVPIGKDEKDNQEIKKVGEPTKFDFPAQSHLDLIKKHDLADLERGNKIAGFRGYFLKKELALMHFALLWYVYLKMFHKGYTPIIAPALVKDFPFFGAGQFPWGKPEVYYLEKDDVYLSGTAEVPVTAYFSNEVLREADLPKKFFAFSPCFRREIGSYGKDTQGLYRVHEFAKIEQVMIAPANNQQARDLHEELQQNVEEIINDLELPYRVLLMCTGDMGEPQAKKYDTEVWMPSRQAYGEVASNSIMTDFQARRLNIRYRAKDGQTHFCYTLNNTALASPRILIAILENYQQKDGSIIIPKVLQSLTGLKKIT
ncbi:serine--tRNA ligase [Candidatus Roizmanbacteria bacterium RIFOXYB2_FULL_41_10]|uniref:Serine--tRNA ligase n=1 Tax=Candidatus Roizmanbacteria bacterium RIFOXYA1_FULL_41_12 TaxID=1802082 RepID=A0A1F7K969_9BACT|nr:MAG: serine--tRNA ligase [Candidatus Roizmanbacteria bacterium RIFOXYA1_FULL_41_12]OGK66979.1 MAG: serine--tRNA ligase [Candidatus Roizmanbacteria bacterium RIFOXYB1_FULL_41_27]OGK67395.1 MAG: serine--tRNA ligase [Candidatus Roizmanbacteria bacterium RIFOXYA2_FULL_41_8]OGK68852.1 MAG: serine--tRNA ligase [Candidatus Roizmanbacteria bacterium RIFOXYB2_FULL_41_10]OGK71998.1 MAG: serine--tRNA ligase [Candidatus Roizmanbacteria bacterium RIFOXYC1_FULL_41_16]OGK74395.1 MAG: serine--tRNA ligase [